ncbi:MAG: hypothetical protein R3A47_04710 [Polyangiales bacterium]
MSIRFLSMDCSPKCLRSHRPRQEKSGRPLAERGVVQQYAAVMAVGMLMASLGGLPASSF